jgi:hypothetical protein
LNLDKGGTKMIRKLSLIIIVLSLSISVVTPLFAQWPIVWQRWVSVTEVSVVDYGGVPNAQLYGYIRVVFCSDFPEDIGMVSWGLSHGGSYVGSGCVWVSIEPHSYRTVTLPIWRNCSAILDMHETRLSVVAGIWDTKYGIDSMVTDTGLGLCGRLSD